MRNLPHWSFRAGLFSLLLLYAGVSFAGDDSQELPVDIQHEFAARLAPNFVFSPGEEYFPCDPFQVDGASLQEAPTAQNLADLLKRAEAYRGLRLEEKMKRAVFFFRVYRHDADTVVVEYWAYYVKNSYSARPLILPVKFGASHRNDLEHIQLILRRRTGAVPAGGGSSDLPDPADYEAARILASAHNINNVFSFPADWSETDRIAVIVENGSHAMAPDVDGDVLFDPKDDADRDRKMIWGIRDHGATFARYRLEYADPRPKDSSVVLSHSGPDAASLRSEGFQKVFTYQLVHQDYLERRYREMENASKEWAKALSAGPGWIKWLFGESQRGDELLLPSRHENFEHPEEMADRRVLRERGFTAGITTMMERNVNLTFGGRWGAPVGALGPDLMWDNQLL
jgi:hypothetical protein